jgi:hypothetical protein
MGFGVCPVGSIQMKTKANHPTRGGSDTLVHDERQFAFVTAGANPAAFDHLKRIFLPLEL